MRHLQYYSYYAMYTYTQAHDNPKLHQTQMALHIAINHEVEFTQVSIIMFYMSTSIAYKFTYYVFNAE